jgi:hypothetical protein
MRQKSKIEIAASVFRKIFYAAGFPESDIMRQNLHKPVIWRDTLES